MSTLINLTPHAVVIHGPHGPAVTLAPSGDVARVAVTREAVGVLTVEADGIAQVPLHRSAFGAVEGLPDPAPQPDTFFIVSRVVAEAARDQGRDDLLIPDDAVRDEQGRIIGCRALARL